MEASANLEMPLQERRLDSARSSQRASNGSKANFIVDGQPNGDQDLASDESGRAKKRVRLSPEVEHHHPLLFKTAAESQIDIPVLQAQKPEVTIEIPGKKRRGRRPKDANLQPSGGSAQVTSLGNGAPVLEPPVRRPPGRPRTVRPPIIRIESEKPQRAKFPGRQRVPHPDPYIEALLVRQGELKRLFRAVVASLKPGLADLSDRSLKELRNEAKAHEEYEEYAAIQQELDACLARRIEAIDLELGLYREKLETIARAQKDVVTSDFHVSRISWIRSCPPAHLFKRKIKDLQEDAIIRAKDDYMVVAQESRIMDDEEATEDDVCRTIPIDLHVTDLRAG
jgi:hypothetical protein